MKKISMVLFMIMLAIPVYGADRTVLMEEGTGTWCVHCPYAARALYELSLDARGKMVKIAYHIGSDPFTNPDAQYRFFTYYRLNGTPTVIAQGVDVMVGSYDNVKRDSARYAGAYNGWVTYPTNLSFAMSGTYNPSTRNGKVKVVITATDTVTETNLRIRYGITETIPYNWQWLDTCWATCRKMLPDYNGVPLTIQKGQVVSDSQNFTMEPSWNPARTKLLYVTH